MPQSKQLLLEWKRDYPNHTGGEAAKILAAKYDLSHDSVRGRLSEASRDPAFLAYVSEELQKPQAVPPSIAVQKNVVEASFDKWESHRQQMAELDRLAVGYFISDRHLGAPQVPGAWELTLRILMDEPYVDVWSAANDWNDNNGQGRWEDTRSTVEKLWDDSAYTERAELNDYKTIKDIHPESYGLAIMGNHDLWRPRRMRTNDPANAESKLAQRMTELYDNDVLLFNRFEYENSVRLNSGLVWNHGYSAASRLTTQAGHAFKRFCVQDNVKGTTLSSVVEGHTHVPGEILGEEKGYPGVKYVSSGTFYDGARVGYSKGNENPLWGAAIVRCEFDVRTWQHTLELIPMKRYGSELVATVKGKDFSVSV